MSLCVNVVSSHQSCLDLLSPISKCVNLRRYLSTFKKSKASFEQNLTFSQPVIVTFRAAMQLGFIELKTIDYFYTKKINENIVCNHRYQIESGSFLFSKLINVVYFTELFFLFKINRRADS